MVRPPRRFDAQDDRRHLAECCALAYSCRQPLANAAIAASRVAVFNDPVTKMAISATQLTLFFSIFSLFFSTPPDKFFPDSASTFH